eukprot:scaffold166890_cov18-Tisochrysis_lutea.AAC.1
MECKHRHTATPTSAGISFFAHMHQNMTRFRMGGRLPSSLLREQPCSQLTQALLMAPAAVAAAPVAPLSPDPPAHPCCAPCSFSA